MYTYIYLYLYLYILYVCLNKLPSNGHSFFGFKSFLTHFINQSNIGISQCTDMSISSRRWPKTYFYTSCNYDRNNKNLKYVIYFILAFCNFRKVSHFRNKKSFGTSKYFFYFLDCIAYINLNLSA